MTLLSTIKWSGQAILAMALVTMPAGCSSLKRTAELRRQSVDTELKTLEAMQRLHENMQRLNGLAASQQKSAQTLEERITYLTAMTEDAWKKNCDIPALARIEFPQNPSPRTIEQYVTAILAVSALQQSHSSTDTPVMLLADVGEAYLPILLAQLKRHVEGAQWTHLYHAVQKLANENTKAAILVSFATYPPERSDWVDFVRQMLWVADARELLIRHLQQPEETNSGSSARTAAAIASLCDPSTYPCLIENFKRYGNIYTYEKLSTLPGIEELLIEAIPEAWESACRGDRKHDRIGMAAVALSIGDLRALDIVIEQLGPNEPEFFSAVPADLRYTTLRHLDFSGSNDEIRQWVHANRNNLRFDAMRRRFYVADRHDGGGAAP